MGKLLFMALGSGFQWMVGTPQGRQMVKQLGSMAMSHLGKFEKSAMAQMKKGKK